MACILAADGGGKQTDVVLTNENGKVLGVGTSGPSSLAATSVGAAGFNLREAVRQACQHLESMPVIDAAVMGLAGMDTPREHEQALAVFSNVLSGYTLRSFTLVNDVEIALEVGTDNPNALAIIADTGSNCFGRNAASDTAKTGGMDFLLSDQGSGYEIGRYVLRSAVKSFDGRDEKSILENLVCEHFHINSIRDLKDAVHQHPLNKTEIAGLAKVCEMAFAQQDPVATEIYDHVVAELLLMASTVINRLHMQAEQIDCVVVGEIANHAYILQSLTNSLQKKYTDLAVITPTDKSVFGAVKLARKILAQDR